MTAAKTNALGDYLRARRQLVRPDVGLVPGARRRVEGLRREELAMVAGISAEYYLRLEVGRDTKPSPKLSRRSRGLCSWTSRPRGTCTSWPTRPSATGIAPS